MILYAPRNMFIRYIYLGICKKTLNETNHYCKHSMQSQCLHMILIH